jgi:predicted RNase H-like HicB family nuclease
MLLLFSRLGMLAYIIKMQLFARLTLGRVCMFTIEVDREDDGRWIAEVAELPGVIAYGLTRQEAIDRAQALSLRVLADRLEHGENVPAITGVFAVTP